MLKFVQFFLQLLFQIFQSVDILAGGFQRCLVLGRHLDAMLQFRGQQFVFVAHFSVDLLQQIAFKMNFLEFKRFLRN